MQKTIKKTNVRYIILSLIFLVTTFNYVDRATLSVAAKSMSSELGFDAAMMGWAFSAFGWAYTSMQIPGGWVLDKYGARFVYGIGLVLWSIFTFMQGFVGTFSQGVMIGTFSTAFLSLFVLRFLMGVAEAPAFPANSRLTVMWFPTNERGLATAFFQTAQYFALAVFTPLMTWILYRWSWHYVFFWAGAAGIVLGFFWLVYVQEPRKHKSVNAAELDYIEAGGGLPNIGDKKQKVQWADVKKLVCNRMMLGVYIGQFCLTTITWFFLTWFPTYLYDARGMSFLKAGFVTAIPALAGFVGGLLGGYWSDWLLKRGRSLTYARKLPIVCGLLFSSTIILANYVDSDVIVVLVMSIAFFSKGLGNLGWCVVGDVSPKEILGLSGGVFNLCGNIASIVTPLSIGYILKAYGSFDLALLYVGAMGLIGTFTYLVVVGPLERLDLNKGE